MSDVTELRAALKLNDGDSMHGDSLLLHAAQHICELEWKLSLKEAAWAAATVVDKQQKERIRELESVNADMLATVEDVGTLLRPWISKAKEPPQ